MNTLPAKGNRSLRTVVLCADDYALHPLVDEAVEQLALQGRLSATSCMTTSPRWKQAARRLPALRPRLSLGLHFNLTEGHGVQPAAGIGAVIARAYGGALGGRAMRDAWRRQLDAFEDALGMAPDFIDGHQHVHQLPGVRAALMQELRQRYGVDDLPWVRSTAPVQGDAIGAQRAVEYAYLRSDAFAQALEQAHCHIAQGPLTPLFTSN
jgi:predicted glycoside hydrolase/deacetylase ChbG (UPF0249 family)